MAHDSEEAEETGDRRRRGIYLLPNLLTTAALFTGFYAIVAAIRSEYAAAAIAVFIAMVLDGLDGRVARLTHTESDFGTQYDSLSDMVCFGLAPALVMYEWALAYTVPMGWLWAKLGWLAAFLYAASAALRLARFNTQAAPSGGKAYFQGLASPAAAATVVGFVWAAHELGFSGQALVVPALVLTTVTAVLMVSNVRYHSFKDMDLRNRVPFVAIVVVVLVFVATSIDPPKVLFTVAFVYLLSGPAMTLLRVRRMRAARREAKGSDRTRQ